ncbi:DNA gyrase/topoisomerase IV subunit A [uncultured Porphyromonas sp.]|uniref:DNA gyrase/topoisomerase IV subunit A n=1 Tax=uncultured Porphyromonas sp. TaxID=159274 RepID=UPI00262CDDAA|nr:DNA gyrase/topoisomerase IV subunit A [uncultured Porphyromonas sp.]
MDREEKGEERADHLTDTEEELTPTEEGAPLADDVRYGRTHDSHGNYVLSGMYRSWFISYASYVILERAVPYISDGLKPVQRRILYTMSQMEDRLIKVANIVGQTMQLHPHGDASIGDALVQLGQRQLLIECQGNWGNLLTGDGAAAPRYIEARLTPLAKIVLFSPKITDYVPSYDGANEEPVNLPVKFPLLLAQGAEGIAVGLSCKILPHNVGELLQACVSYLRGEPYELYPDFPTGGLVDVAKYSDGERGGQVKVRARIEKVDSHTLAITELPYSSTTGSLIDSILKANETGKIKIKKINDKTAAEANIEIQLPSGVSPDKTIDALYAFTGCEISISPNCCVVRDDHPEFLTVSEVLADGCERTMGYIRAELGIRLSELQEQHLLESLEQLFITRRIYKDKDFEEAKSVPEVVAHIRSRLEDALETFFRPVTDEDLKHLLELKMARILKFNKEKSDASIARLMDEMADTERRLGDVRSEAISWYETLYEDFGKQYPRRTTIRSFDDIEAAKVAVKSEKLYVDRKEGFIGTGLKKAEYVSDVSDIDDVIVFLRSGVYFITKVSEKSFVGKDIIHVARWVRGDERTIYNAVYRDGKEGTAFIKRFAVTTAIRDREYDLTRGKSDSKVLYFTANPNGEAEVIKTVLRPSAKKRRRKSGLIFETDFADLLIKGRQARGNILTKEPVFRISLKEEGKSTLGGRDVWFDRDVFRLNYDDRGDYLGEFMGDDKILVVLEDGTVYLTDFSDSNHFERNLLVIEQYDPEKVWTLVYHNSKEGFTYLKRFLLEEDKLRKKDTILTNPDDTLLLLSDEPYARVEVVYEDGTTEEVEAEDFIAVKGVRAKGKRVNTGSVTEVHELEPLKQPEDEADDDSDEEDTPDEEVESDMDDRAEEEAQVIEEVTRQQRLTFRDDDEE